jgi:hypothetical protein
MPDQKHNHINPLSENVEENIKKLEMALGNSDDISIEDSVFPLKTWSLSILKASLMTKVLLKM